MIRAYLDETGQHAKDYVIIAGHVGDTSRWLDFVGEWNKALGRQRKRLHLHDLNWSKLYTKKLLARLGPVPAQCGLKRLIGGSRVSDYADLIAKTPGEIMFDGYPNALFIAIASLLIKVPSTERIEVVFERQDRYAQLADATMHEISITDKPLFKTSDGKPKLARWSFVPKNSTMLFDQADYLCYALLQKCRDEKSQKAEWCSPILESGQSIGEIVSKDKIRKVIAKTKRDLGWDVSGNKVFYGE